MQVAQADFDYYVLEISSFQLDNIQDFAPHITLITNITPDHLDRYNYSLNKYKEAKLRITENQTSNDFFLFNADDPILKEVIQNHQVVAKKIPFGFDNIAEGTTHKNDQIRI